MPSVQCNVRIDAPAERVFEVFADLRGATGRIQAIRRLEVITEGPVGKGTKFRETRVMFGKEATATLEITGFDPPRSYTVEAESCGVRYISRFDFKPQGSATLVEMSFRATPISLAAKLMSPVTSLMFGSCRKMMARDMNDLRAAIEAAG